MTTSVLSIGSNVGDRLAHLRAVARALGPRLRAASSVYRTAPWGGVRQQPFLNAVLVAEQTGWTPADWLSFARSCEQQAQRTREVRWGPRTLDVDVVAVYDADHAELTQDGPELTIPHPRAHQRAFVLAPWVELQPDAVLPQGRIADLLSELIAGGADDQQLERLDGVSL